MFGLNDNKEDQSKAQTSAPATGGGQTDNKTALPMSPVPSPSADLTNKPSPVTVITPSATPLEEITPAPEAIPTGPTIPITTTHNSDKNLTLQSAYDATGPPHLPATNIGSPKSYVGPLNGGSGDDLLTIKQNALHSLAPLVQHLDQTPEEKFKTTLMLIQASDNSELISDAYVAANQITDEKARAQALLDIVNEINYFTQHANQNKKPV